MPFKMSFLSIILCFTLTACSEAEQAQTPKTEELSNQTPARQLTVENQDSPQDLSCLEQCGQEARGTIYTDCLTEGGDKLDCRTTGRQWYRECLETRCGEEALQQDNCRTDCRINAKEEIQQCIENDGSKEDCRLQIKTNVQSCIAECE